MRLFAPMKPAIGVPLQWYNYDHLRVAYSGTYFVENYGAFEAISTGITMLHHVSIWCFDTYTIRAWAEKAAARGYTILSRDWYPKYLIFPSRDVPVISHVSTPDDVAGAIQKLASYHPHGHSFSYHGKTMVE
jgi:hypothetical protein